MFFQKFLLFLTFLGFALAQTVDDDVISTVTVKTDVFSTSYATVTMTGSEPTATATETSTPTYSIFTSTETGGSSYYPTATGNATATGNSTLAPSSTPSNIVDSGAGSRQISAAAAGFAAAVVAVYAALL